MDPDDLKKLLKRVAIAGAFFGLAVLFRWLGREGSGFWRAMLVAYAIVVSVILVLVILVQSGRGGGLASIGGLGGEGLLGSRAATPIAKATYVIGALLLFICMLISSLPQPTQAANSDVLDYDTPEVKETGEATTAPESGETRQGADGEGPAEESATTSGDTEGGRDE